MRPAEKEMSVARLQASRIEYGSDDPVVAEAGHRRRVDLEMEVRRAAVGVTGVSDEADDVARLDAACPSTASGE